MKRPFILAAILAIVFSMLNAQQPEELPLFDITQLSYEGAFRIDASENGVSNINYSQGPLAYNYENHSIFIVSHAHEQAIAEYAIPEIVKSEVLSELAMAEVPLQVFSGVLQRTPDGNQENIDRIGGLLYVNHGGQAKLIINGYEYYDAPGDNSQTTMIINDANALETSMTSGFHTFDGGAGHTSGWLSPIPDYWQEILGGTHITGQSSGIPIISRTSVGPSAFAFDIQDALNANDRIATTPLLDFSLENPLHADLANESKTNLIWTHLSRANYGFIVPGTRTYLTIGNSGGYESGVCYKCTQDDGNLCGGYCPTQAADRYQFYWLWDMNDLVAVKEGRLLPYNVRPYDYGEFNTPFQAGGMKAIGGGSFDPATGNLYLSVQWGDTAQGIYARPPVIVMYNINGDVLTDNQVTERPSIRMYPNPTADRLFISGLVFESEVQLTDVSGKTVRSLNTTTETVAIDMTGFSTGMYTVSVRNKATNVLHVEKILKRNQ